MSPLSQELPLKPLEIGQIADTWMQSLEKEDIEDFEEVKLNDIWNRKDEKMAVKNVCFIVEMLANYKDSL